MKMLVTPVLGLLVAAGQNAGAPVDRSTTLFADEATRVSFQYPAAFKSSPAMAEAMQKGFADRAAADPERAAAAKCLAIPLVAIKGSGAPGGGEFGMIVMMKADYQCAGEESGAKYLGEDAQRLMGILERFGKSSTEDALRYKLAGHPAAFVKGSAPAKMLGDGSMVHAASVCTLVGRASLCWLILDTNYKIMPTLVAAPVSFDGSDEVALVPQDMVSAW